MKSGSSQGHTAEELAIVASIDLSCAFNLSYFYRAMSMDRFRGPCPSISINITYIASDLPLSCKKGWKLDFEKHKRRSHILQLISSMVLNIRASHDL